MEINLISDTVTKPSKEMLEFMMSSNVGDDVFKDDPTVNELEHLIATKFGMESALFFPQEQWQIKLQLKYIPNQGIN
jgi:threonine aldolase